MLTNDYDLLFYAPVELALETGTANKILPRIEAALLLYAERNPEDAQGIERVLQFRRRVAEEFKRLAADGGRADGQTLVGSQSGSADELQRATRVSFRSDSAVIFLSAAGPAEPAPLHACRSRKLLRAGRRKHSSLPASRPNRCPTRSTKA